MKETFIKLAKVEVDISPRQNIYFMGDLHNGANSQNEKLILKKHIRKIEKDKTGVVFLGGDLLDVQQFGKHASIKRGSIENDIESFLSITEPIHPQIAGITWGNHEERLFRDPVGVGTMPNLLYGHMSIAEEIKEKNPELVCTDLQCSLFATVNMKGGDPINMIIKHGHRSGKQSQVREHDEILRLIPDLDIISLHHTHSPYWWPTTKIDMDGKIHPVHIFRGSAYVGWMPYQQKKNLPPPLMGCWKVKFTKSGRPKPQLLCG